MIPEDAYDSSYDSDKTVLDNVTSAGACQNLCQTEKWCYYFQWNLRYNLCWMKKSEAPFFVHYDEKSNKFRDEKFMSTNDFIFGPKYCNG